MRRLINLRLINSLEYSRINHAHTGDFDEGSIGCVELDKEYKLTDEHYTIDDFIEDLKEKGYIKDELKDDGTRNNGQNRTRYQAAGFRPDFRELETLW
jgi:hypothetical protein